jgi:DDE superfamily endonuclease
MCLHVIYYMLTGFPSIQLQLVCDSKLMITDAYTGYPGSVHDARVFRLSPLQQLLTSSNIPEEYHIIGDSAYPLSSFLMVPYRDNGHLTAEQIKFNKVHSSTRVVVERCIGLLKCKWRRLKYLDMSCIDQVPTTIIACCVLHNFILFTDHMDDDESDFEPNVEPQSPQDDSLGSQSVNLQADAKRRNIARQL